MSPSVAPVAQLPEITRIDLTHGGTAAVWDTGPGPVDAPPLVLLHGWNVTSFVNYGSAFDGLAEHHRVIAIDHRGHGQGPRSNTGFTLDTCVDDVVGVLDGLGVERSIVVGYSLGGVVGQLVARRRPDRVAGLVLAATRENFSEEPFRRAQFVGLAASAEAMSRLPAGVQRRLFKQITAVAGRRYPRWILEEVLNGDPVSLLEAGAALGTFDSRSWIADLDAPTSVVVTTRDTVVNPRRQWDLAANVGAVATLTLDGDHDIPVRNDPNFTKVLLDAVAALGIEGSAT